MQRSAILWNDLLHHVRHVLAHFPRSTASWKPDDVKRCSFIVKQIVALPPQTLAEWRVILQDSR